MTHAPRDQSKAAATLERLPKAPVEAVPLLVGRALGPPSSACPAGEEIAMAGEDDDFGGVFRARRARGTPRCRARPSASGRCCTLRMGHRRLLRLRGALLYTDVARDKVQSNPMAPSGLGDGHCESRSFSATKFRSCRRCLVGREQSALSATPQFSPQPASSTDDTLTDRFRHLANATAAVHAESADVPIGVGALETEIRS